MGLMDRYYGAIRQNTWHLGATVFLACFHRITIDHDNGGFLGVRGDFYEEVFPKFCFFSRKIARQIITTVEMMKTS